MMQMANKLVSALYLLQKTMAILAKDFMSLMFMETKLLRRNYRATKW